MILQGLWLPVLFESFMGIIRQIQPWSAMFLGEAFLNFFLYGLVDKNDARLQDIS